MADFLTQSLVSEHTGAGIIKGSRKCTWEPEVPRACMVVLIWRVLTILLNFQDNYGGLQALYTAMMQASSSPKCSSQVVNVPKTLKWLRHVFSSFLYYRRSWDVCAGYGSFERESLSLLWCHANIAILFSGQKESAYSLAACNTCWLDSTVSTFAISQWNNLLQEKVFNSQQISIYYHNKDCKAYTISLV